jgi:hypothetical protein
MAAKLYVIDDFYLSRFDVDIFEEETKINIKLLLTMKYGKTIL